MKRIATASLAAFCASAGLVLGEFVTRVRPVEYLVRPLLVAAGFSFLVGAAASLLGRWSIPVAVFAAAWVIQPAAPATLVIAAAFVGLLFYRIRTRRTPNIDRPMAAAVGVFLVAGIIPVVGMLPWSGTARAEVMYDGPAQYAILMDGHPRADTLAAHSVDISPFTDQLEDRGFVIYEDATSEHHDTFGTLTGLLDGEGATEGLAAQRETRQTWRLPDGWEYIAPPVGHVVIPNTRLLNPGGFSFFETELMAQSLAGDLLGGVMMDGYRSQLNRALDLLRSADHQRVFAHIFAPHAPILYGADGDPVDRPDCFPECPPATPLDEMAGYIEWVDRQIIDVVDSILTEHPDAEIVLFSDHGGRFDPNDREEWHRVFLASRTLTRPNLFADLPHPRFVLDLLEG